MAARLWNKAPFVRLLAALVTGIVLQWHLAIPIFFAGSGIVLCVSFLLFYSLLPVQNRYRLHLLHGAALLLLFVCTGSAAVWLHDVRNQPCWFGKAYRNGNAVLVTLEEPLVEKAASYKALASVETIIDNNQQKKTKGSLLLYFKKDSLRPPLYYGSQLLLTRPLQAIKNAGNPGSFDYQAYSLFQGITHQAFLGRDDYVALPSVHQTRFQGFLYTARAWVVAIMQEFIHGEKEQGLAEALLIGYKDDLDKNLVQAYSNTGVVHIIAISGLHLGLIYGLLLLLTAPLKKIKKLAWLRLLFIVAALWLFSILAGGGPSVLRSALMFTLLALGQATLRKTNMFNTLAFSAFVLLCIDPFWLWDVGFQLSYAAVLSIVLFFQPIYRWFSFQNKAVDCIWKLTAVTLSAQLLTLPISVYHFHQMPVLFLLTNLIAVPLSSLILLGEIALCALFFWPAAAGLAGHLLTALISLMNAYIEGLDRLPFSTWNFLSINIPQTLLLLVFVLAFCYWLLEKERRFARTAFFALALFMLIRGLSFFSAYRQQQLIVYNVPKHPAMDIINGRHFVFLGDSALLFDGFERNFHLQPSRILHRISQEETSLPPHAFTLAGKKLFILDDSLPVGATPPQNIDVLILSRNPKTTLPRLLPSFRLRQVVIDGAVPPWKAALWKKDCDSLRIPCHNVSEDGAFVMNW